MIIGPPGLPRVSPPAVEPGAPPLDTLSLAWDTEALFLTLVSDLLSPRSGKAS